MANYKVQKISYHYQIKTILENHLFIRWNIKSILKIKYLKATPNATPSGNNLIHIASRISIKQK